MTAGLHKFSTVHLLLHGVVSLLTTGAGAQMAFISPNCNFQEVSVSMAPCMAGGGGNISGACCSSLNRALDAGHRCVCSLLLANPVFASLVTNLLTLPLLLPLPGCFLYAPSLAACQATTMPQQTNAPPTATSAVATSTGGGDPPTAPDANVTPPPSEKKSTGPEKADGGRVDASTAGSGIGRSSACRRQGQGPAYALTFLTAIVVSWINCMTVS